MIIKRIPFQSEEGYEYILKFLEESNEPHFQIYSISIDLHSIRNKSLSLKDLFTICKVFRSFLEENQNRILTYVCDDRQLHINDSNKNLSPQEYRKKLFDTIFKRLNTGEFYKKDVTLKSEETNQYLAFIGLAKNENSVNECAKLVIEKLEE